MADSKRRYLKLKDGTRVPGSTTICGQLDKPFLVKWANGLGLKGIDSTAFVENTAIKGTLIHDLLEHLVLNKQFLNEQYDVDLVDEANEHIDLYKQWASQHKVEPIWCEEPVVSELYKYGGFIDFYCIIDGKYTVVDFKTSKQINNEHLLQLSSYVKLFQENNLKVDQAMIINVGKNPADKFSTKVVTLEDADKYFKLFKALLSVYYAKKEINYE